MVTIVELKFAQTEFTLSVAKKFRPLRSESQMARAARRVIENSRHPAQSYIVLPIEN